VNERFDARECLAAYPTHLEQLLHRRESSESRALRDDALCHAWSDARQQGEVGARGVIEIEPLALA
jgi:hypothetical protein